MELVNEWSPTRKFREVDTTFSTEYTHEKELMVALPLTGNSPHKVEMEYHGKIGHALGRIQRTDLMSRIHIFCANCRLATQTLAPNLPNLQGIKRCVQYLDSHPHKPIFILLIIMMDKISSKLHGLGIMLNTTQPRTI